MQLYGLRRHVVILMLRCIIISENQSLRDHHSENQEDKRKAIDPAKRIHPEKTINPFGKRLTIQSIQSNQPSNPFADDGPKNVTEIENET